MWCLPQIEHLKVLSVWKCKTKMKNRQKKKRRAVESPFCILYSPGVVWGMHETLVESVIILNGVLEILRKEERQKKVVSIQHKILTIHKTTKHCISLFREGPCFNKQIENKRKEKKMRVKVLI